ncbi:MAG TPA: diguanylate cyclase [Treponema sp.]|nr:diguanylate cyclase [Treponema sp.]
MARDIRKSHYRFIVIFMLFLCGISISLTLWTVQSARIIHAQQTYTEIYSIKKMFLKNTVQNMVRNIERMRIFHQRSGEIYRDRLYQDIERIYSYNPNHFASRAIGILSLSPYGDSLSICLSDDSTHSVLFQHGDPPGLLAKHRSFGKYTLSILINPQWVEERTKTAIHDIIHEQDYENGGYIWVNEIINWEGGPNYAIRLIHPNVKDSEGIFLSTETRDIAGNTPYKTELEGVRNQGEIFFSYFFKHPDTNAVSQKITYATLYMDYNWIIAMGFYLDDVQVYVDGIQKASTELTTKSIFITILSNCLLFIFAFFVLSRREHRTFSRTKREITEQSNIDSLTGAYNRRVGMLFLEAAFVSFHESQQSPTIFMLDIDDFKSINDEWGHPSGDEVLRKIVRSIQDHMRLSDRLIRWGGEEFLLLCPDLTPSASRMVGDKIREAVMNTQIIIPTGEEIHVTVSIGIGYFNEKDSQPDEAINRSDKALYAAKAAGKNCVRV